MQWRSFAAGFVLASIGGLGGGLWLAKKVEGQPVWWMSPSFYDDGNNTAEDTGYVKVSGALIGEGMDGSTYLNVECRRRHTSCTINELQQWGSPPMVSINNDYFDIKSWSEDTIIAESDPLPEACNRVRLVIVRASKTAQYVRIPQPQADQTRCQVFNRRESTWTLGEQPVKGWF